MRGLREVLTATGAGIYLATHVAGPIPAETQAAVHESDEMELRLGRVGPDRGEDLEQREKEARAVAAAALRVSPERVILMHGSAQAAQAITLHALEVHRTPHKVLLLGSLQPGLVAAISAVADAMGATVSARQTALRRVAADTALVVLGHVDIDGVRADVAAVSRAAHQVGALLLVDAGLSAGALDFGADELGADVVIADTHHWLLGPEAMAICWLSPEMGADLPRRLRSGVAPFGRGTLLALARSVGWLLMYVELPWALARTKELAERLYDGLAAIDGVEVRAPAGAHGAIAAFRIAGWEAEVAGEELSRSIFAILEADVPADLLRASVGAWNREGEVDRIVARVTELAAHTPETLPRRPALTIIHGPIEPDGPGA